MAAPELAVVTVSYYSDEVVTTFLGSLSTASSRPVPCIVVNNAPNDAAIAPAVAGYENARLVNSATNLGYGKAMNLGVSEANIADWILLANPDLTFAPGALDELVAIGEKDSSIGVLGPLIYTTGGEIYPSARRLPSLRHGIGHALFFLVWKSNPWTKAYLADRENPPRQRDAGWLSGACLLVRRSAFESVGGFDDKFFMYFEDVDLCERLGRAGWKVVYAPSAVITHIGGHSTDSQSRTMIKVHHRSAYTYLSARYSAWYFAPLRIALRFGLWARAYIAKS